MSLLISEDTRALRGWAMCPALHNWQAVEEGFKSRPQGLAGVQPLWMLPLWTPVSVCLIHTGASLELL